MTQPNNPPTPAPSLLEAVKAAVEAKRAAEAAEQARQQQAQKDAARSALATVLAPVDPSSWPLQLVDGLVIASHGQTQTHLQVRADGSVWLVRRDGNVWRATSTQVTELLDLAGPLGVA